MIQAKVVNHEDAVLGYCSFAKASHLLSKGVVKVKKLYPYTLVIKGAQWREGALNSAATPSSNANRELTHV